VLINDVRSWLMLRDLLSVAAFVGVGWLIYRMEKVMAQFEALNAKLDEQDAARAAAQRRALDELQALRDEVADLQLDAADQASVDAAVGRVQSSIDALNAFEPVRAGEEPAAGGEAEEPAPADGGA
jgi:hypothetical protein